MRRSLSYVVLVSLLYLLHMYHAVTCSSILKICFMFSRSYVYASKYFAFLLLIHFFIFFLFVLLPLSLFVRVLTFRRFLLCLRSSTACSWTAWKRWTTGWTWRWCGKGSVSRSASEAVWILVVWCFYSREYLRARTLEHRLVFEYSTWTFE